MTGLPVQAELIDGISEDDLFLWSGRWKPEMQIYCDKMRLEGRHSPDRGDAVLGCIVCGSRLSGSITERDLSQDSGVRNDFAGGLVTGF